ncbi:MAG: cation:proton antiporter [Gemmatimonadales bacterium]|jgi:NhaP-type Na+/H+ or K+/H+ antiporter|nr:cation:proton antiporter [Gemmatimonadales bacterium]
MHGPTGALAALAALVFVGLALEWLFRRTGIPDVLVLLGLGLVASANGLFRAEDLRGFDRAFTTIALVLILFEGAVHLRLDDLRRALRSAFALTLLNFFATMVIVGVVATLLFGMRPLAGALLGAIMGGASPAVVIPLVRTLKLSENTRTALTLESALADVLCIVFALALLGALAAGSLQVGQVAWKLAVGFLGALVIGAVGGMAWAIGLRELRRRRTSMVATGAAVFLVYALAEAASTSGPIACMAFGVVLGNAPAFARKHPLAHELDLSEGERIFIVEVAFLLKVFFFVYLGAALKLSGYQPVVFGGLATVAIFALRPAVVRVTLRPPGTTRRDASIAAALVPKGLAAAVLAQLPRQAGIVEGSTIEAVIFGAILLSIIASSVLVFAIDRPFVAHGYGRFFGRYPETAPAPEAPPSPPPAAADDEVPLELAVTRIDVREEDPDPPVE